MDGGAVRVGGRAVLDAGAGQEQYAWWLTCSGWRQEASAGKSRRKVVLSYREMKGKTYKTNDYMMALRRVTVAPHHLRMLQAHYHAPDRTLTATQMSKAVGYGGFGSANLHYGRLGRIVGEAIGWTPLPTTLVGVLAEFEKPAREWHWIMRPTVADALEQLGWVHDDQPTIPEEVDMAAPLYEGAVRRIAVNAYERSSIAREKCILHYGCRCAVCGLNLAEKYGEAAQGLIHVHHLRQLADVNAAYEVDPVQDLRPVCPTCHAVIHNRTPLFTVQEVTAMIEETKRNANQASVTARKLAEPQG